MLAGDFNTVFDRFLDRRGSDPFDVSRESSCALNRLLNACSSIDIWRYLHPTSSSYTWTRSNGSLSSRIDFILVPHVWVPSVSSCDIVACPFSDHCAVVMSVCVPEVPSHGPGVWKLNLSVLNDPEYISLIIKGGRWNADETTHDINYLEILPLLFALQSSSDKVLEKHIKLLWQP